MNRWGSIHSWKDLKQDLALQLSDDEIKALCSVLDVPPAKKGKFVGGVIQHLELFSWMEDIHNIKLSESNVVPLVRALENNFVHRADLAEIVQKFRIVILLRNDQGIDNDNNKKKKAKVEELQLPDTEDEEDLPEEANQRDECVVCKQREKKTVCLDCGCANLCIQCCKTIAKGEKKECPTCRKTVVIGFKRIYL